VSNARSQTVGRHRVRDRPVTGHNSLKEVERYTCLVRDERQKPLGPRPLGFFARRPGRWIAILALVGRSIISVKLEDHDIRAPILGMGREVSSSRSIRILFKVTTNRHDLQRTVLLDPLLDQVNCVRKPADEGCVDRYGCPFLATARPVAVARRSRVPPQGRPGFPSAHK
jgi:hypothetical protein